MADQEMPTVSVTAESVQWQTRRCPFAKPVPTQNQDLKREDDWSTVSVTAESVQWQNSNTFSFALIMMTLRG